MLSNCHEVSWYSYNKKQAENLSVLEEGKQIGEIEIIQSAKALKMRAKLCKLKLNKLKDVKSPIIAKSKDSTFFIVAKSKDEQFMILFPEGTKPEVKTREELMEIWDGTAILISKRVLWIEKQSLVLSGLSQQF